MRLRQEQVVLLLTVLLLGWLYWSSSEGETRRPRGGRSRGDAAFIDYLAPDPALALPVARDVTVLDRDVLSPPRDTRPLPPLDLEAPPLPVLTALAPPPSFQLSPRIFGDFLRAPARSQPVPGLFVATAEEAEEEASASAEGGSILADLAALGGSDSLSPEEREAQIQSWRRLYDWILLGPGDPTFGQIKNEDRYGLPRRPDEPILFVEIDPRTGQERFSGMDAVSYTRDRVTDFGFADTASNRIQLRRREFLSDVRPGQYTDLLEFAQECISLRLEAREALDVAKEMFNLAIGIDEESPAPELGLARCYEAAFEYEKAYEQYLALLERFGHRPEVHVHLGRLEARLRLFESAEERFQEAERQGGRLDWRVQWAYGEFLYERGRFVEAVEHLERAQENEPLFAEARALIRTDLGAALLAVGRVDQARDAFDRALQANDGNQRALAGRVAAAVLAKRPAKGGEAGTEAGFDLLVSRALVALSGNDPSTARDLLELAADTDPLRAGVAWRALSWIADVHGFPQEAYDFIERAYEADPTDPWSLYQRGRVLSSRDDLEGARESFMDALDQELDFPDALIALGVLAHSRARHLDADRFLERALTLAPRRADVHALRGLNLLESGDVTGAVAAFDAAHAVDPEQPLAHLGLAWAAYRRGDSDVAIRRFAELDDRRRALDEEDHYRVFAKAQIDRIQKHEAKVAWSDRFERRTLKNGWDVEEAAGPLISLTDGQLVVKGTFKSSGRTRFHRTLAAPDFVSIEMDVTVRGTNNARVAMFVTKERRRGAGETQVQSLIAIGRHKEGDLLVMTMDSARAEPEWTDVPDVGGEPWWPMDRTVRLRIEVVGEGSDSIGRISIDGIPVTDEFSVRRLTGTSNDVRVGLFVEGQTGLPAEVVVDNVELVYKIR